MTWNAAVYDTQVDPDTVMVRCAAPWLSWTCSVPNRTSEQCHVADSDEVARAFRFDGAQDSDMKSPRAWSLAGW
jgi:hypothetical protein